MTQQDAENGALLYGLDAEMNQFKENNAGPLKAIGKTPIVYRWQNQKDGVVQDVVTAPLLANGTTTDERSVPLVLAHGQANAEIVSDGSPSLTCNHEAPILFGLPGNWIGRKPENGGNQTEPFHDQSPCLTKTDQHAVAFPAVFKPCIGRNGRGNVDKLAYPLTTRADGDTGQCYFENQVVRRFTPTECERLQGMPDDYTRISWRNSTPENCPDGPRYRAIGNSMAVPVMRWIGERIDFVHKLTEQ